MSVTVEVTVSEAIESSDEDVPDRYMLESWVQGAYLKSAPAVASILVTTADEMQQFNKKYRNKDLPTNVLSFPMHSPVEVDLNLLGDIILCAPVIRDEAIQQSKSAESHWAHMIVHGMLHLQGYDHVVDEEAVKMEQKEIDILERLGYTNPYKARSMKLNSLVEANEE